MSVAAAVRAELEPRVEEMAALVAELAGIESPTDDRAALDRMAARLLDLFAPFGPIERFPQQQNGDHFVVRIPGRHELQPALALCHYDTVWPLGSLREYPVTVADGIMRGPGVFDMKGGIVCLLYALQALEGRPNRPLWLFFNSDEETGSHSSRGLIEDLARGCAHALVYESPLLAGALKTARKGTGRYSVAIEGRAAHAGVEPEKGISAVLEAAHQTIAIHGLNAPERGSTLNVGVLHGGTRANVVAAHATIEVDVRVSRADEASRIDAALRGLRPVLEGAHISVSGGLHRPPMERSAATAVLLAQAQAVAAEMGVALGEGATGGGSDGNFTAALGLGTLDGLGPEGRGAHAADEQLLVESLPRRAALSAGLLDVL